MTKPLTAFILAAGLGERLRPITFHIPKPLLPIAGRPALQCVLEKVSVLQPHHIAVNLHYKGQLIRRWIQRSAFRDKVTLYPEDPILGTGGALKNAEVVLSQGIFLVHNSDVLSDVDLKTLIDAHLSSDNLVTLALHDFPQFNNLLVDGQGYFKGISDSSVPSSGPSKKMAFTGIAVYSPDFLSLLPVGRSSVIDAWLTALSMGYRIGTHDVSGCYWTDIGTPSAYAAAVIRSLKEEGETVFVHPSLKGCSQIEMDGYVVAEKGSVLPKGGALRNCILLSGRAPAGSSAHENCILISGSKIQFSESEMLKSAASDRAIHIGTGGSDKQYYRIREEKGSSVLVQAPEADQDFQRYIEYTRFFWHHGVPVPELRSVDFERKQALLEDLGDLTLYSWLKCARPERQIEVLYERVLDIGVMLHTEVTRHASECPLLGERLFDYGHLRWETTYFVERFVQGVRNVPVLDPSGLEKDFHLLALQVDSFPKTIIHRDFQSQNIMVTRGTRPRLIDYQGARIGPPAYDVVSLLWDPYYHLDRRVRERLLRYYVDRAKKQDGGFDEAGFTGSLVPCRLQRHMQALGAYGFLTKVKRKKYFLKHAQEGMRLLREDVQLVRREEYPALHRLVVEL